MVIPSISEFVTTVRAIFFMDLAFTIGSEKSARCGEIGNSPNYLDTLIMSEKLTTEFIVVLWIFAYFKEMIPATRTAHITVGNPDARFKMTSVVKFLGHSFLRWEELVNQFFP